MCDKPGCDEVLQSRNLGNSHQTSSVTFFETFDITVPALGIDSGITTILLNPPRFQYNPRHSPPFPSHRPLQIPPKSGCASELSSLSSAFDASLYKVPPSVSSLRPV